MLNRGQYGFIGRWWWTWNVVRLFYFYYLHWLVAFLPFQRSLFTRQTIFFFYIDTIYLPRTPSTATKQFFLSILVCLCGKCNQIIYLNLIFCRISKHNCRIKKAGYTKNSLFISERLTWNENKRIDKLLKILLLKYIFYKYKFKFIVKIKKK